MTNIVVHLNSGREVVLTFDTDEKARDAVGSISMIGFGARSENGENQFVSSNEIKCIRMGSVEFPKGYVATTNEIITDADLML